MVSRRAMLLWLLKRNRRLTRVSNILQINGSIEKFEKSLQQATIFLKESYKHNKLFIKSVSESIRFPLLVTRLWETKTYEYNVADESDHFFFLHFSDGVTSERRTWCTYRQQVDEIGAYICSAGKHVLSRSIGRGATGLKTESQSRCSRMCQGDATNERNSLGKRISLGREFFVVPDERAIVKIISSSLLWRLLFSASHDASRGWIGLCIAALDAQWTMIHWPDYNVAIDPYNYA